MCKYACASKNSSRCFEWGDLADEAGGRTFSTVQKSCLGTGLMEQCFTDVRVRDYQITVTPIEYGHRATVSKSSVNAAKFTVVIPATRTFESRFGTCNCGKPAKDGIPCEHMVAVVKSSMIGGLSRIQIMPYWWTTAHWRTQYAVGVECRGDVSISTIKGKYSPDKTLCYCPAWTAGKKKGCPKSTTASF